MAKAEYFTHVRQLDLNLDETSAKNGFTLDDLADQFDFFLSQSLYCCRQRLFLNCLSVFQGILT
jgi:hypothetical protein